MVRNALITNTFLGIDESGTFTSYITVGGDNWKQSFGGFPLSSGQNGKNLCESYIKHLLGIAGIERWEDLRGSVVRIDGDEHGIHRIGHIIHDIWLNAKNELDGCANAKT